MRRVALVLGKRSTDGWVAHGFSRGEHESANHSCPPPLKRWATQSTMIHRISAGVALVMVLFLAPVLCQAQDVTIRDAKKDLSAAKKEIEKVVVFRSEEKGGGAFLKSEYKTLRHRRHLESKAEKKGVSKDEAERFDMANLLEKYDEQIEPEAFEMLVAYVGYVKEYRRHQELIKENEPFAEKAGRIVKELDTLIDRHGRRLCIPSLKLLYEDDPVGKVGTFNLPGVGKTVRIDGREVELLKLRTLKDYSVLIRKDSAKKRTGFLLAEIVGKDTYRTDDGTEMRGILLQAY